MPYYTEYYFLPYYKYSNIDRIFDPFEYIGIGTINGLDRYGIFGTLATDIPATPALSAEFFQKKDQQFRTYLKNYKGRLNGWLKNEAIRRGVL